MMKNFDIVLPENNHSFTMVFVEGTKDSSYLFGIENEKQEIRINDFFISKFPVTQKLFQQIMYHQYDGNEKPAVNVSYDMITGENGFWKKLGDKTKMEFRLPAETEWEYAARGGIHWKDNFTFSGSNNLDEVGWYHENSDHEIKTVGQKKPNQLGIYDMCGNVWEWCHDHFVRDTNLIPKDGRPCLLISNDRVLRGGCNHNGAIHCTVNKRYEIPPDTIDHNIGFRLVLSMK